MDTNEHLLSLAQRFGTPLYTYDADTITRQYERLRSAFSAHPTRFFYACKALTNIHILRHMRQLGTGLDCVSIQEVRLGLHAGFQAADILFTPNSVSFDELCEAQQLGVNITIDNLPQLERFGHRFGDSYPVLVRINPNIEAGGNYKISTGHIDSKFGISVHQLRHIQRVVKATGVRVRGIHMHTGSEIKDIEVFLQGLDVLLDCARHFDHVEVLDLGSGFKVPYRPGEKGTPVEELGIRVAQAFADYEKESGKTFTVWFEPGKFLVSEAGNFLVTANVIKQTTATVFVGVDSGFNHLIRPMFYDAYHHIDNLSSPDGHERIYTVVGNICETDTFAWDRVLPEVHEGDVLCFRNAGAYGFEMSSRFNARFRPAEVLIEKGNARLIRRRETLEDLLRGQEDAGLAVHEAHD